MNTTDHSFALALMVLTVGFTGSGGVAAATPQEDAPAVLALPGVGTNADVLSGEIVETMNSGGYTYVLIDTGSDKVWAAATETAVKVGQRVSVPKGQAMAGFSSKTLNRTFDEIYFVPGIYPEGALHQAGGQIQGMGGIPADASHAPMAGMSGSGKTVAVDAHVEGVAKADGGYTVEEILAQSSALSGHNVKVRGRVVKFSPNIMGTNWMHIQDGTPGDLTVTTDATVAKGDVVMVEGPLSVNKDIGAGYRYAAIIEKAKVSKE